MRKNVLTNKITQGVASVAIASVVNKVIAFISNIVVVRLVSQYDYGLFSSANNIIMMAMLFTGLGTINGVLQYGAETRPYEEKLQYFKYSAIIGVLFDLILTIGICLYAALGFVPINETKLYVYLLAPSIVLHYIFEYLGAVLRSAKETKKYANLLNVNSISFSILSVAGAYFFGIAGMSIGRSIAYALGILMGLKYNRKIVLPVVKADSLTDVQKKELLVYSLSCCITAALNRVLYVLDIFVISYSLKDATQIAIYRVGTTIPESLEFIPQSILIAVIPYFAEHNKDNQWLRKWTKKLYLYSGLLNSAITIALVATAPFIVKLFWGEEYSGSIPIFVILSVNYFVMATFRQIGTNIISTLRRVKYNVVISVITCLADIVLDVVFVKAWGIEGAAYATLIVVIIASVLSFPYVFKLIYERNKNSKL